MDYTVTCKCGAIHVVSAAQAGSTLECKCRRSVEVPRLSVLRRSAGESPVPTSTLDRLQALIQSGVLPGENACPYSGRPANCTIYAHVQCERKWIRGGDNDTCYGRLISLSWLGLLQAMIAYEQAKPRVEFGRDTCMILPLRISSDVVSEVLAIRRQWKLKGLLRKIPAYAELLQEFPDAVVMLLQDDHRQ